MGRQLDVVGLDPATHGLQQGHQNNPVDVDVLTRLHEYATGIANQNGRHDVRRGEAACIVAGVESVQSYLRRNPGVELEFALIQTDSHPSAHIEEGA